MRFINRFLQDESGSNALEYGLIVALVSLAVVTGATAAGTALGTMFTNLGNRLDTIAANVLAAA
jgi:pilus assembly protein Flp/PilA